jgi:hypothetical protein
MKKVIGFFTTKDYDSSADESEEYDFNREEQRLKQLAAKQNPDSQSPEEKAKQARFEPYNKRIKVIMQNLSIFDFVSLLKELNELQMDFKKNKLQIENDGYPKMLFKMITKIEELNLTSKEKNRMKDEGKKALSRIKQATKRLADELIQEMADYAKNPILTDDEPEISEEEEDEDPGQKPGEKDDLKGKKEDSDSDKDSDSMSNDSDNEWDEKEDETKEVKPNENMTREERRKKWLKDPNAKPELPIKGEGKDQNRGKGAVNRPQPSKLVDKVYKVQDLNQDFSRVSLEEKGINRRMVEECTARGQTTDEELHTKVELFKYILNNSHTSKARMEIIVPLINFINEKTTSLGLVIERSVWQESLNLIQEYLMILNSGESFLQGAVKGYLKGDESFYEKKELEILFMSFMNTLDLNWQVMIRNADPETVEYANLLKDELDFLNLIKDSLEYFKSTRGMLQAGNVAFKILEHIYFLSESSIAKIDDLASSNFRKNVEGNLVENLTKLIFANVTETSILVKSALYMSFNYSVNGKFTEAKDLLLMHNIAEKSNSADPTIGYIFNRALSELASCAFSKGKIEECQTILDDFCNSGKIKDLLNQASMRGYTEREEKRFYTPYHMSLSVENIETVYYISVLLNEAPLLVTFNYDNEKRGCSKLFQRLWVHYEKMQLNGPPENFKDYIYCSARALIKGDWQGSFNYLSQLKIWNKFEDKESIQKLYLNLIKRQAFKAFICSIKNCFHILKFDRLGEIFELSAADLTSLTCEMIYSGDLQAKLDTRTGCLVTGNKELGDIEYISDKINQRVYNHMNLNEKLFDVRFADMNFFDILTPVEANNYKSSVRKPKPNITLRF